jgi:16S rRNA processing protein RimM
VAQQSSPRTPERLAAGVVTGTHGVSGWIKVRSYSDQSDHLAVLREAVFRKGVVERVLALEEARALPRGVLLKVRGMDSPERARSLVGWEIWVPRPQAARLLDGEYYVADLCGCSVWFGEEEIGSVRSVWDGGPSQLLEVLGREGKTHLVPFIDHFVGEVDVGKGRIVLREDEIVR